jgi:hypothetical protein
MVRLDTKLAATIEKRLLTTLVASEVPMEWIDLVYAAKCDRWWELTKHVYGYMKKKRLARDVFRNHVEAIRTGYELDNYAAHLMVLQYQAGQELRELKALSRDC